MKGFGTGHYGEGSMHQKALVIDSRRGAMGSFNWTWSASNTHAEDLYVLSEPQDITRMTVRFAEMWARS